MKKPWSKIRKGDVLDLGGREWAVEKIKPDVPDWHAHLPLAEES